MMGVLSADFVRMVSGKRLWVMTGAMVVIAMSFVLMQYTAMDYSVPLSRVIFLPMSFYGVVAAALVSMFVGENYSDGILRNKLSVGRSRRGVYLSLQGVTWMAAVAVYLITTLLTLCVSLPLFEVDVTFLDFVGYLGLGICTCLAYSSLFCMLSVLIDSKPNAVMVCMGTAFAMLIMSLHTHQRVTQPMMKDGLPNPHYVSGVLREVYFLLHDLNPTGQAAQLSAMTCLSPLRWLLCDVLWMGVSVVLGTMLLEKKDIR